MEQLDDGVAPLLGPPRALRRPVARIVDPPVVRRHQGQAAQGPCRMDLCALALVLLRRRLGLAPSLGPLAAKEQKARQHHDVERVVAARPGLGADRLPGHRDRTVEVVGDASQPERTALGPLLLPRPAGDRDEADAALDVPWARRPHEPDLPGGAQEQDVRTGIGIDRHLAIGRLHDPDGLVEEADPAFEVELHHEVPEPPEHPRAEPGAVAGLLECQLAQLDRLGHAPVVVADDRAQAQGVGARGAGWCAIDRDLEDPVGLEVLGHVDEQALGGEAGAVERGHRIVRGRQAARLLIEARGVEGRAAVTGVLGGLFEGRRDGLVRAVRRVCEMACPRVLGLRRCGQGFVRRPKLGRRREAQHRLGEQWVGEPDGAILDDHELVLDRRLQVVIDPGLARSSVAIVGSAAAAARSIAWRVGSGSRDTRPAMSEPRLSGTGSVPWPSAGIPCRSSARPSSSA